ncbi:MAG TPA: hypothetical protein VIL09_07625 [Microvirga sp.]|jgi:hypothetical protein
MQRDHNICMARWTMECGDVAELRVFLDANQELFELRVREVDDQGELFDTVNAITLPIDELYPLLVAVAKAISSDESVDEPLGETFQTMH